MDYSEVKWPARTFAFYAQVKAAMKPILTKTVLAIDPSSGGSSQPGYAVFTKGELVACGELKIPSRKSIQERLGIVYDQVGSILSEPPDVLALEDVSKGTMGHEYLKWSAGVTIAAARAPTMLVVPINIWRAVAKATPVYEKTNTNDAVLIGMALVMLARKFQGEQKVKLRRRRR